MSNHLISTPTFLRIEVSITYLNTKWLSTTAAPDLLNHDVLIDNPRIACID